MPTPQKALRRSREKRVKSATSGAQETVTAITVSTASQNEP